MRSCLLALLLVVNPTQSLLVGSGLSCAAARPRMSIRMEAEPEPLPFISDDTYKDEVIESSEQGQPVIVDFFADWCGPCKLIEPLLRDLNAEGAVKVVKAKPEQTAAFRTWLKQQSTKYGISGLPTLILFEKGKPARSLMGGFDAKKLRSFVGDAAEAFTGAVRPSQPARVPIPVRADRREEPNCL